MGSDLDFDKIGLRALSKGTFGSLGAPGALDLRHPVNFCSQGALGKINWKADRNSDLEVVFAM